MSRKAVVAVLALAAILVGSVVLAGVRERRELPRAAAELRSASEAAGEVLSCLQGVQDELAGGPTRRAIAAARSALALCDVSKFRSRVRSIRLPTEPPLTGKSFGRARADIEAAVVILERMVLDARAAVAAMAADLEGEAQLTSVVLSYRAFAAGDARSSALSSRASAHIEAATAP